MAEPTSGSPSLRNTVAKRRGPLGVFMSAVTKLTVRFYAAAILLVVVWAGYTAVAFLVRSVFRPTQVPAQYLTWQTALSGGNLPHTETGGEMVVPRAPMEHYHRVDRTLPVDRHNGCLTSGCHNILAHQERKEMRAFANLHATFLACTICHDATITGPTEAMWVSMESGRVTDPPAALQLMRAFEVNSGQIEKQPAEFHTTVARLLPGIVAVSRDPALEFLSVQIATSEPGSPVWRKAIAQLGNELPGHVRGEYGDKLTRKVDESVLIQQQQRLADLAREYRATSPDTPQRRKLHDQIHEGILPKPSACLSCHGGEPARLNFEALGYSPQRAAALRDSVIARWMQQIQQGEPFYLPKLLEGGHVR